jgi:PIN domain nuclease of toxin-antitoxin system
MDTHALFWLLNGEHLEAEARVAIADAQDENAMFVSAVSAWEAAVAVRKRRNRPNLGERDAAEWFQAVLDIPGARMIGLPRSIACAAAEIPTVSGWSDPFDCLLIATARIKKLPIITRDKKILDLSVQNPRYVQAIRC